MPTIPDTKRDGYSSDRYNPYKQPELTASFVVIGTKLMFESGYEQYLPIERIITHPLFRGWTADLAMVFTFSGMTSEKPGNVIPLAVSKSVTHVDSNVTVLSWGKCSRYDEDSAERVTKSLRTVVQGRSGLRDGGGEIQPEEATTWNTLSVNKATNQKEPYMEEYKSKQQKYAKEDDRKPKQNSKLNHRSEVGTSFIHHRSEDVTVKHPDTVHVVTQNHKHNSYTKRSKNNNRQQNKHLNKTESQHQLPLMKNHSKDDVITVYRMPRSVKATDAESNQDSSELEEDMNVARNPYQENAVTKKRAPDAPYENFRRNIGEQKNSLTIETFAFVNLQSCKKIVERTMPKLYAIKNGDEVLCYSSEDHYITMEDSGAPALQNGRLVAVTVGGVEADGEHVAIGMKMSCFCPWIAENLPNGAGDDIDCCKNCCGHQADKPSPSKVRTYKGKGRNRRQKTRFAAYGDGEDYKDDIAVYDEEEPDRYNQAKVEIITSHHQ